MHRSLPKVWPGVLNIIPEPILNCGIVASFLHVLCYHNRSENIEVEWQKYAYKELLTQLRLKRFNSLDSKKKGEMVTTLRQFTYLIVSSKVEI